VKNDVKSNEIEDIRRNDSSSKTFEEEKKPVKKLPFNYLSKIKNVFCNKQGNFINRQKIYDILTSFIIRRTDVI